MFNDNVTMLTLYRESYTETTTIGRLYINGEYFCYTLEDAIRPEWLKISKQTCIPAGVYRISCTMSNRFKVILPELKDVPNFDYIRMHGGNDFQDTDGCILVAYNKIDENTIQGNAARDLVSRLCMPSQQILINIINIKP